MIVTSSLAEPGCPARQDGVGLVASFDVAWTNHPDGLTRSVLFGYSVTWLHLAPAWVVPSDVSDIRFDYTSFCVHGDHERRGLVDLAVEGLRAAFKRADLIVGCDLGAGLAVLATNAVPAGVPLTTITRDVHQPPGLETARAIWARRQDRTQPQMVDVLYDVPDLSAPGAGRLAELCRSLHLDYDPPIPAQTTPEDLYRDWTGHRKAQARERITLWSLQRSLAAGLVALRALDIGTWTGRLSVHHMLARQLPNGFLWLSPVAPRPGLEDLGSPSGHGSHPRPGQRRG